jgi:hypothetical protein
MSLLEDECHAFWDAAKRLRLSGRKDKEDISTLRLLSIMTTSKTLQNRCDEITVMRRVA